MIGLIGSSSTWPTLRGTYSTREYPQSPFRLCSIHVIRRYRVTHGSDFILEPSAREALFKQRPKM